MMLTIDQIKQAHGPSRYTISVPEWGGEVLVRRMTASDYIKLNRLKAEDASNETYLAEIVSLLLINEDGTALFEGDAKQVLVESPIVASRIGAEILRIEKLGDATEKNSESSPS